MRRPVHALISTAAPGFAGVYIGAAFNLEGYLGIILSIAIMGFFIIQAIENKNTNKKNCFEDGTFFSPVRLCSWSGPARPA